MTITARFMYCTTQFDQRKQAILADRTVPSFTSIVAMKPYGKPYGGHMVSHMVVVMLFHI